MVYIPAMKKPEIIAIAALGKDTKYICAEGQLLWHNPEDLKRVKELTLGYPLIMGRKTHDSIGRPLPRRTNIILTRDTNYTADGCAIAHTIEEAIEIAEKSEGGSERIFIFGGSEIYDLFLDRTDKLFLTLVDSHKKGDKQFPEFESQFIKFTSHGGDIFEEEAYEWVDYVRKSS
jgi:dihydrofolate reductase